MKLWLIFIILLIIPVSYGGYTASVSFPDSLTLENDKISSDVMDLGSGDGDSYNVEIGTVYQYKDNTEELTKHTTSKQRIKDGVNIPLFYIIIFILLFIALIIFIIYKLS